MKVFVASARGPAIDEYRTIAIQEIRKTNDSDLTKWTVIQMDDDAHPGTGSGDAFTTAQWGPGRITQCDAVLLIVAGRYGSLVEGQDREVSYTELEYETALDNNVRIIAWVLPESTEDLSDAALGRWTRLSRDSSNEEEVPDQQARAKTFSKRVRANGRISQPLPLELEGDNGFRSRLRAALEAVKEETQLLDKIDRATGPSLDDVRNLGVRAQISGDQVVVTWESTLEHGSDDIHTVRASLHSPRTSLLAVRRAGTNGAYVVLRSYDGIILARVTPDGPVKTAFVAASGIVQTAELMSGPAIGTLSLTLTDGHVTTVRTDQLEFQDMRSADVAQV